ncbi:MAG: hypothetical protein IJK32_00790 [Bacteroidales bacterium]|nr:hypothetical protein [Bacteroidales bacterium]
MRRFCFISVLLSLSLVLHGQNYRRIKEDPSYIWGEGIGAGYEAAQSSAVDELISKLSATDLLEVPYGSRLAVWKTYRRDIIAASGVENEGQAALRYIAWKDVDKIFSRRKALVGDLLSRASGSKDPVVVATCADWALTLLDALPADQKTRRSLEPLRNKYKGTRTGDIPGLSYVGREVESIRAALGKKAASVKPATATLVSAEPVNRPSIAPLASVGEIASRPAAVVSRRQGISRKTETYPVILSRVAPRSDNPWSYYLLLDASAFPSVEGGLFFGAMKGSFGGYVSARRGFGNMRSDYSATSDGRTDFGYLWVSGETALSRYSMAAGALIRAGKRVTCYAGAGYGRIDQLWEDTAGQWARITDISHQGVLIEAGLIFSAGKVALMAGASSVSFATISPIFGLGIHF